MFYSSEEAAKKLGISEDALTDLVREGKLREFRDAGTINYKISDVDGIAPKTATEEPMDIELSGSDSGEILLEAAEDSGSEDSSIELSPSASDVVSLDESAAGGSISGTTAAGRLKEDTAVPSVGVNVFDDDDLDENVDPLAQTVVSDLAGLGMDGMGSGSGILDLTRESDDTSLGRELLEEIYTTGDDSAAGEEVSVGDDTRAGLDAAGDDDTRDDDEALDVTEEVDGAPSRPVVVREVVAYAPDAVSASLTAVMAVGVFSLLIAGLGAASMVQDITPSLLRTLYSNLWIFAVGAVGICVAVGGVTYALAKRRE